MIPTKNTKFKNAYSFQFNRNPNLQNCCFTFFTDEKWKYFYFVALQACTNMSLLCLFLECLHIAPKNWGYIFCNKETKNQYENALHFQGNNISSRVVNPKKITIETCKSRRDVSFDTIAAAKTLFALKKGERLAFKKYFVVGREGKIFSTISCCSRVSGESSSKYLKTIPGAKREEKNKFRGQAVTQLVLERYSQLSVLACFVSRFSWINWRPKNLFVTEWKTTNPGS